MANQDDYLNFIKYCPSSREITLKSGLNKFITNSKHFEKINLDAYEHEFGSNVNKDNFQGYITILKNSTFRKLKKIISEKTGFPLETMIGFGKWGGEECDEYGEVWTMVD